MTARPPPRSWEQDLAVRFQIEGDRASPLSTWIRNHLEDRGRDYPYRMFRWWQAFVREAMPTYDLGDYADFRQRVNELRRVGLIQSDGTEPGEGRRDRHYYTLVPDRRDDPAWQNPRRVLYPQHYS